MTSVLRAAAVILLVLVLSIGLAACKKSKGGGSKGGYMGPPDATVTVVG